MIKILFFLESLGNGGAEKVLSDLVCSLDKNKYETTVMTVTNNGIYEEIVNNNSIYKYCLNTYDYESNMLKKMIYSMKYHMLYKLPTCLISRFIFKQHYDIGVAFVEGFSTKLIGFDNIHFDKKYAWVHVDPIERDYADNYFSNSNQQMKCYGKFDKIFCVSKSVRESFVLKHNRLDKNKIFVQYNMLDAVGIKNKSLEYRDFILNADINFISIGRLTYQKGFDRLCKIVKRLKDEGYINFKLWILGEGDQKNTLLKYINNQDLNDTIYLMGFQTNPYKYLVQADMLICSSRAEGFGLVIEESLILGVPVLSVKCSGPNEVLNEGNMGILVENDDESLYQGLKTVLNYNDKIFSDERNKLKDYVSRFDKSIIIKELERIFDDVQ